MSLPLVGDLMNRSKWNMKAPCPITGLLSISLLLRISLHASLLKVDAFPITIMFGMCSIFLFVAALLQRRLMVIADSQKPTSKFCNLP